MDSKYNINTNQNVNIEVKIAGLGDRVIALFYDTLILIGLGIFFGIMASTLLTRDSNSIYILWAIMGFVAFLFHFIQEWAFRGQSIGKIARNIKVVKTNGVEAGFFHYLIRNLIRPIDSFYGIGLIALFFTKKFQRLGDLAAGTIVIKLDKKVVTLEETIHKEIDDKYEPVYNRLEILKLDSEDIELIKELTNKPNEKINWELIGLLANKLKQKTGISKIEENNKQSL